MAAALNSADSSAPRASTSSQVRTPSAASCCSVTRPIPGILRTGSVATNAATAALLAATQNWPSGLLMSEATLASILLGATPQEQVRRVSERTRPRSRAATCSPVRPWAAQ
jgi:hypothetical protein